MCGIAGILAHTPSFAIGEALVASMRDRMPHRGPDDAGAIYRAAEGVALGHRRLSIVDLSTAGHQPMSNEDGTVWITFNGEIYNHRALRTELKGKGHVYRSATDTETILHLYEEEGPACVERLHGMFAFAIWDAAEGTLFIARDRLGIKPLYYAELNGGFIFGSEIKALLAHPALSADLNEDAFFDYLTFMCTPAPATMFTGVRKLGPAERMIVARGGHSRVERYWSPLAPSRRAELAGAGDDELRDRLLELLRGSIDKRMMSDVPFGVFLSGGVDSTTNVALMDELMSAPVQTFSVGFDGEEKYNELAEARTAAQRYRTDHHEVLIGAQALEDFIPELVFHQDEPLADWVCVPLHFVSKLARESGTIVVQVGEGSDEIFHGYRHYVEYARLHQRLWEPARRLPKPLLTAASRVAVEATHRLGRGLRYQRMLRGAASDRLAFWGGAIVFEGPLKAQLWADGARRDSYEVVERLWREAESVDPGSDLLQKMTYLELKQRLAELLLMRVDKMTMATSVEARVPFLDHELVEFAVSLPPRAKVRDGTGKWLLKSAVQQLIGHEVAYRPKQGFGAPVAEWFRGPLGARARETIDRSALRERGLLDYDRISSLWEAHHRGAANWAQQLWLLYNASAWYDYWIAGR